MFIYQITSEDTKSRGLTMDFDMAYKALEILKKTGTLTPKQLEEIGLIKNDGKFGGPSQTYSAVIELAYRTSRASVSLGEARAISNQQQSEKIQMLEDAALIGALAGMSKAPQKNGSTSRNGSAYSEESSHDRIEKNGVSRKVQNGKATAWNGEASSEGTPKTVPNPNGRNGGIPHQTTIDNIKPTSTNGRMQTEYKYSTPNGTKSSRYADKVEIVDGEVTKIYQVGKVNQNGLPVSREAKGIEDIMNSPDYNGAPIYFTPYNSTSGPIIYLP